jgi:hypothetical protein
MTNVINKYFKFEQCSLLIVIFYLGNYNICVYTMKLICRKLFPRSSTVDCKLLRILSSQLMTMMKLKTNLPLLAA